MAHSARLGCRMPLAQFLVLTKKEKAKLGRLALVTAAASLAVC